ncbi:DUF368 domain-containing protein [Clostridium aminobutyricum]|uniref:DUF368 domain-containing protein n=1 Tax=Clostridium aminobutyricum TaxID=33953 RepID=A0A939D8V9_CLOAM|nr:DUF368 domain-containing protein [Clostridium aminobutyricum]MBN7772913.1 DUF368 domain-containing protein [Clostridium aminobutyricum]
MKDRIGVRFVKGFIIGASMLIPGVSGGTMAIILGIYDDLIHAVSSLKQDLKANGLLLLQFGLAGAAGIVVLSGLMLDAVTAWHKPMMYLFLGAIIGSIPPLYKKATIDRVKPLNVGAVAVGSGIAYFITMFPENMLQLATGAYWIHFLVLFIAGIIIAIALVLPGISASYVLLMLGMYDLTLKAIRIFDLKYLIPLAIGVVVGTFLTAGVIEREMKRHPQFTYMLIIGFMLGSLLEVFPGVPNRSELLTCITTFMLGSGVILWIGKGK